MKPNQWQSLANFQTYTLQEKLDLLQVRREMCLQQQQEVLGRLAELACHKHELIERQTIYELHSHVFWLRPGQDACAHHRDEAVTTLQQNTSLR
ncbi:MAG TPA: hypothetical protein VKV40_14790 [Ktedonobacteraceae bacterium]|jgi:hypothetical protein|nr:hypothetical protein [Ktedonobacteraceae bacterium]